MRKIILLLTIIGLILCQELIVENIQGQQDSGQVFQKSWQNTEWNNYLDFAIYGWFKINSKTNRSDWATGFHFTSNQDSQWTNSIAIGDRVLAFQVIGNTLHNPTYSIARGSYNYYENLEFATEDADKWAFLYVSFSSEESGFEQFQNIKPDIIPSCPIFFTGCNYSGHADSLCNSVSSYNVTSIHSIYLPPNYTATLHDQDNYQGKKIVYSQSIECISQYNWAYLLTSNAISIEDEKKTVLRRNKKIN
ncbi:hypothetical protein ABPG73_015569 [Tetrahymena malaccensis]